MAWLNAVLVLYAALNIVGGIQGFLSKQSMPSLISGVASGLLLIVAVLLSSSHRTAAYVLAGVVAFATLGFFAMRFMQHAKLYPAGVMCVTSIAVLGCLIAGHLMRKA